MVMFLMTRIDYRLEALRDVLRAVKGMKVKSYWVGGCMRLRLTVALLGAG